MLLANPVNVITVCCREGEISLCTLVARPACLFFCCCHKKRGQDFSQSRSNDFLFYESINQGCIKVIREIISNDSYCKSVGLG